MQILSFAPWQEVAPEHWAAVEANVPIASFGPAARTSGQPLGADVFGTGVGRSQSGQAPHQLFGL